jgi:hypothetical protein
VLRPNIQQIELPTITRQVEPIQQKVLKLPPTYREVPTAYQILRRCKVPVWVFMILLSSVIAIVKLLLATVEAGHEEGFSNPNGGSRDSCLRALDSAILAIEGGGDAYVAVRQAHAALSRKYVRNIDVKVAATCTTLALVHIFVPRRKFV